MEATYPHLLVRISRFLPRSRWSPAWRGAALHETWQRYVHLKELGIVSYSLSPPDGPFVLLIDEGPVRAAVQDSCNREVFAALMCLQR